MKVKYNESTPNRPWGERPVDAPLVPVDLHAFIQQVMEEKAWQENDRNAITVFKSDQLTVVLIALHKDAEMKPGNMGGTDTFTLQVLDGSLTFRTEKETIDLARGQMLVLHEHTPYSINATSETMCLLTMVRENNTVPSPPVH